ncbi:hypothetical protein J3Q64DRAFT_1705853, partial [Phycomyces blakesleeanus]
MSILNILCTVCVNTMRTFACVFSPLHLFCLSFKRIFLYFFSSLISPFFSHFFFLPFQCIFFTMFIRI